MTMFDYESKLDTLAEDFDLIWLLEENDISIRHVVKLLVEEGLIDPNKYIDVSNEERTWAEWEE